MESSPLGSFDQLPCELVDRVCQSLLKHGRHEDLTQLAKANPELEALLAYGQLKLDARRTSLDKAKLTRLLASGFFASIQVKTGAQSLSSLMTLQQKYPKTRVIAEHRDGRIFWLQSDLKALDDSAVLKAADRILSGYQGPLTMERRPNGAIVVEATEAYERRAGDPELSKASVVSRLSIP